MDDWLILLPIPHRKAADRFMLDLSIEPIGTSESAPEIDEKETVKIVSVLSAPRFGPTDCFHSIMRCLIRYGIDIRKVGGANWGQSLERGIEQCVEEGADWILTWDYDTVIQPWQFERLLNMIGKHPEYDAIAPLEVRRESKDVLASFPNGFKMSDLDENEIIDGRTAHFGCTLIRASALRKMPKPWFEHIPAPNGGGWGPGHMDDDIGFWHKLRATGSRLGIATKVCIGHSQIMVTWLLNDGRVVQQHMNDYHENGPPENVRK